MNAYINIYGDNPTAGASDGTLLSDGAACVFNLNTATLTSQTVRLAVRTAAADYFTTSLTISSTNPNNRFFKFAWNESDTFQNSISTTDKVSNTNKIFYVKTQITDEGASIDTSCKITLTCKIPALYYLNMPLNTTGRFYQDDMSGNNYFTIEVKLSTTSTRTQDSGTPRFWPTILGYYDYSYYASDSQDCMALCSRNGYLAFWARNDVNLAPANVAGYGLTGSSPKINDGNVHFAAAIVENGAVTLCVDGTQVGYKTKPNAVAAYRYNINYSDDTQTATRFAMKLYEIRLWTRNLGTWELGKTLNGTEYGLAAWLVAGANNNMIVKAGNVSSPSWGGTSVCYEYITPSISADVIRNITGPVAHLCARVSDANIQIPLFEAACNPAVVCRVNNKNLYSPLVSVSDDNASPIRIKVGGVVYALRR